jgi:hypothetical protein
MFLFLLTQGLRAQVPSYELIWLEIYIHTVKRPKFDILFGENIFFLQNLFRWPPSIFWEVCLKFRSIERWSEKFNFHIARSPKNTFLQMSNLGLVCLTSSCERIAWCKCVLASSLTLIWHFFYLQIKKRPLWKRKCLILVCKSFF